MQRSVHFEQVKYKKQYGIILNLVNLIKIMFEMRKELDDGIPALNLGYEQGIEINPFFETDTDLDDTLDLSQ